MGLFQFFNRLKGSPPKETMWKVGDLNLTLPGNWHLAVQASQRLPRPGPPGAESQEDYAEWQVDRDEQPRLHVFWWAPYPPRPGGPLAAAEEWPAVVAGQAASVIRTSQFMGKSQEVLVTHLRRESPAAYGLVYASGLDREGFMAILKTMRIGEAGR
jgi:hypothetical protein